jgi:hypothetical protein
LGYIFNAADLSDSIVLLQREKCLRIYQTHRWIGTGISLGIELPSLNSFSVWPKKKKS